MLTDTKQLIVKVSPRFHDDIKNLALKKRMTMKEFVIAALVQYINKDRHERFIEKEII